MSKKRFMSGEETGNVGGGSGRGAYGTLLSRSLSEPGRKTQIGEAQKHRLQTPPRSRNELREGNLLRGLTASTESLPHLREIGSATSTGRSDPAYQRSTKPVWEAGHAILGQAQHEKGHDVALSGQREASGVLRNSAILSSQSSEDSLSESEGEGSMHEGDRQTYIDSSPSSAETRQTPYGQPYSSSFHSSVAPHAQTYGDHSDTYEAEGHYDEDQALSYARSNSLTSMQGVELNAAMVKERRERDNKLKNEAYDPLFTPLEGEPRAALDAEILQAMQISEQLVAKAQTLQKVETEVTSGLDLLESEIPRFKQALKKLKQPYSQSGLKDPETSYSQVIEANPELLEGRQADNPAKANFKDPFSKLRQEREAFLNEEFEKLSTSQNLSAELFEYMAGSKEQQDYCKKFFAEKGVVFAEFLLPETKHAAAWWKDFSVEQLSRYLLLKGDARKHEGLFEITVDPNSQNMSYRKCIDFETREYQSCTAEEVNQAFPKDLLVRGLAHRFPINDKKTIEEAFQKVTETMKQGTLKGPERLGQALDRICQFAKLIETEASTGAVKENKLVAAKTFEPLKEPIRVQREDGTTEPWEVGAFFYPNNQPGIMRVEGSTPHYLLRLKDGSYVSAALDQGHPTRTPSWQLSLLIYNPKGKQYHTCNCANLKASLPPPYSNKTVGAFLSEYPMDTSGLKDFFKKSRYASHKFGPGLINQLTCFEDAKEGNLPKFLTKESKKAEDPHHTSLEAQCRALYKALYQTPEGREKLHQHWETINLDHLIHYETFKERAQVLSDLRSGKLLKSLTGPKKKQTVANLLDCGMFAAITAAIAAEGFALGVILSDPGSENIEDSIDPETNEVDEESLEDNWKDAQFEAFPFLSSCDEDLEKPFIEEIDRLNITDDLKAELYQGTDDWLENFPNEEDRSAALKELTEQIHQSIDTAAKDPNPSLETYETTIAPQLEQFKEGYLEQYIQTQTAPSPQETPSSGDNDSGMIIGAAAGAGVGTIVAGLMVRGMRRKSRFNAAVNQAMKHPSFNYPNVLKFQRALKAHPTRTLNRSEAVLQERLHKGLHDKIIPMYLALKSLHPTNLSGPAPPA